MKLNGIRILVARMKKNAISSYVKRADKNWRTRFAPHFSEIPAYSVGVSKLKGFSQIEYPYIGYLSRGRDGKIVIPARYTSKYMAEVASGKRKMKAMRIPVGDQPTLVPDSIDSQVPVAPQDYIYRTSVRRVEVPTGNWGKAHKESLLLERDNFLILR